MRLLVKAGFVGPYTMDFQNLNGVLVQVKEGALRGLRREKEGWPGSQKEIVDHVSTYAVALNVANDLGAALLRHNDFDHLTRRNGGRREAKGEGTSPPA